MYQSKMSALLLLTAALLITTPATGSSIAKTTERVILAGNATVDEAETAVDFPQSPNNRKEKLFSVFQIVQFTNTNCTATDGTMGVCFTAAECTTKSGVATGSCAQGFGVCCVFKTATCGSTISQLVTYIQSPNYPAAAPAGMCMYTINKCDSSICQFKVDFVSTQLTQPAMGDCRNDTLVISGVDAVSAKVVPATLCGTLTGQSLYVSVNNSASFAKFAFNIVSAASNSNWLIKITQIPCTMTSSLAPYGCLTYSTGLSGSLQSFNYAGGAGQLLNNNCYSSCIASQPGYCDVALTASKFDLDANNDFITFGTRPFTGMTFGTANSVTWNFTGPYVVPVCFDGLNVKMNMGFDINYLLLPC